jgi:deazaflavin-dependent oxidoreductase (nitroreductase family)
MSGPADAQALNAQRIAEVRANGGKLAPPLDTIPLLILTTTGARTGQERSALTTYSADGARLVVIAAKGGAPTNPDWYYNLTAAGEGSVERGTESYQVTVRELTGAERDRVYAEQARRYPGFAEYDRQTAGIRTIPVLELTRS